MKPPQSQTWDLLLLLLLLFSGLVCIVGGFSACVWRQSPKLPGVFHATLGLSSRMRVPASVCLTGRLAPLGCQGCCSADCRAGAMARQGLLKAGLQALSPWGSRAVQVIFYVAM
jgi:hypothetical protein